MIALLDLCPRNMMSRCLCHDNTVAKFPFDFSTIWSECRPKKVSDVDMMSRALGFAHFQELNIGASNVVLLI